jgi:hypothetical protein
MPLFSVCVCHKHFCVLLMPIDLGTYINIKKMSNVKIEVIILHIRQAKQTRWAFTPA